MAMRAPGQRSWNASGSGDDHDQIDTVLLSHEFTIAHRPPSAHAHSYWCALPTEASTQSFTFTFTLLSG